MNTPPPVFRLVLRRVARLASLTTAACFLTAGAAEPTGTPPKTHTLFMGANLAIVSKDSRLPVKNVQQNSFVVQGPRGEIVVHPDDRQFQLKVNDALKLATDCATVDHLAFERTYTPGNDPMQKFADAARVSAYMASGVDSSTAGLRNAEGALGYATAVATPGGNEPGNASALEMQAHAAESLATAQTDFDRSQASNNMDVFSTVGTSSRLNSDLNAERFDALRVTFQVSSPRPLTTPYVVIFLRFLQEKDRPDTASVWIYAERLPDIDEHPHKVTILRGGFPPGYQIDSYHVHLYEGPTEIATSVARKRVALTTDEAFQYSVIDYAGRNRELTVEPSPAKAFWPADLSARLTAEKLDRILYVKVRKDGTAAGLFEDQACTQAVGDAALEAVLPDLRFQPALAKGKPVEGVVMMKLGRKT